MDYSMGDKNDQSVLLTLSGGGYRAMLFHVGALWKLNEIGELRRLAHISSVSGGPTLRPACVAMNWTRLDFATGVATNFRDPGSRPLCAAREMDLGRARRRIGTYTILFGRKDNGVSVQEILIR